MAEQVAERWRETYPQWTATAAGGEVAVFDAAVCGLFAWLGAEGVESAPVLRGAYDVETGRAFLQLGAHLPWAEWRRAVEQSALADVMPEPGVKAS